MTMGPGPRAAAAPGTLEDELLRLLARQGRRLPLPVFIAALMLAWLGRHPPATSDAALLAWLALVAGVLAARMLILGKLPGTTALPARRRLRMAVALSAVNGCTHALAVVAFTAPDPFKLALQTLLLVGLCAGSVATTAGYRPVFLAYVVPVMGVLLLRWAEQYPAISFIIGMFGCVLVSLAGDAYRMFRESFDIRLQQIQLNARLTDALGQAEAANRAKTRFLASASHDLRQPIHTVSLFAAALGLRPLDPVTRDISRHIDDALHSLSTQLDALLDISRLDAGIVPVHLDHLALAPFLQRMCDEYRPIAAEQGLALDVPGAAGPDGGPAVLTDPVLLRRLVGNLLDNAIKYTQAGAVRIALHAQSGQVVLGIEDTGPGIPRDEQEHVFEEFYQLGNPERNRVKGLGLGLSIVHRLAGLLQVRLEMVSAPGQGTAFYLILPAAGAAPPVQASHGADVADVADVAHPALRDNALAGLRVLVVDDEAAVREGMRTLLAGLGAAVVLADGALQAHEAMAQQAPDLLLVDFRLRGQDNGIALAHALRAQAPALPAILISGDTSPERLREASAAGIPMLHKPVSIAQLQQLAARLVPFPREVHHVH